MSSVVKLVDVDAITQKDDRYPRSVTGIGVITFHRRDEGTTRVTAHIDWQPDGVLEKVGAVVGFGHRQVQSDMARFKSLHGEHGNDAGGWRGDVPAGS